MIVVDASLALKLVLEEHDSQQVRSLWSLWTESGESLCAPALFRSETLSGVRRSMHRGRITADEGKRAYEYMNRLVIEIREPRNLYDVAWAFAERFDRPVVYDSCYLALADIIGCALWTADQRLANTAHDLP